MAFDIDGTLCHHVSNAKKFEEAISKNTDCATITDSYGSLYVFKPHVELLFRYLLAEGARITFFSIGVKNRNVYLMDQLLIRFYGQDRYDELVREGQFKVFYTKVVRSCICIIRVYFSAGVKSPNKQTMDVPRALSPGFPDGS